MDVIASVLLAPREGGDGPEPLEFTAIDFETTDLKPGRLIEVGAVRMRSDGTVLRELSTLVDPGPGIDPGATWVHRITRERLDGAPLIAEVMGPLLELCEGSVLVAHNLKFEGRFLAHELALLGIRVPPIPGLCTLEAARAHLPGVPNHRLGTLVNVLELEAGTAHAALDDARACGRLLAYLLNGPRGLGLASRPAFAPMPRLAGTTRFKPRASGLYAGRRGWMAALMDRLPISHPGTADPVLAEAYVAQLTDTLATGRMTRAEARVLARQAERAGMSRDDVLRLHRELLEGLRRVAGEDLPPAKEAALQRAARILGLQDGPTPSSDRILVLGSGGEADEARRLATEAGAEVAQRLTARVTHVVTAGLLDPGDPRLARARSYGVPILTATQFHHWLQAHRPPGG